MIMQWLYLFLAIVGAIVPLSYLLPFLLAHNFDVTLLFKQLFENNVSAGFGLDVVISALVLFAFVSSEGKRRGMGNLWAYVVCTLTVGVSFGLPLFLFFRELKLSAAKPV